MLDQNPPPHPEPAARPVAAHTVRRVDSAALLGAQREVLIVHGPQVYRLRITAQGKLILTK
jgi:hemin uptake protein HemP